MTSRAEPKDKRSDPRAGPGHHVVIISALDFQAILGGLKRHLVMPPVVVPQSGDLLRLELVPHEEHLPYLMVRVTAVELLHLATAVESERIGAEPATYDVRDAYVVSFARGMGWNDG